MNLSSSCNIYFFEHRPIGRTVCVCVCVWTVPACTHCHGVLVPNCTSFSYSIFSVPMTLAFFVFAVYLVLLDASFALEKSSNCPLVHTFFYAWWDAACHRPRPASSADAGCTQVWKPVNRWTMAALESRDPSPLVGRCNSCPTPPNNSLGVSPICLRNPNIASSFPSGAFEPPEDAGTSFWPQRLLLCRQIILFFYWIFICRGLYSSSDPVVLDAQMAEIHSCGIDIAVISWWGRPGLPTSQDGQGVGTVLPHNLPNMFLKTFVIYRIMPLFL